VITTAVRWYFRYRLSAADVRDLLAERRIDVSARTILAWAHKFGPLLAAAGRRQARPVGTRWYADETYVRVGGRWAYLYRAVDEHGQVVDVLLRAQRDLASARAFFDQAIARRSTRCTSATDVGQAGHIRPGAGSPRLAHPRWASGLPGAPHRPHRRPRPARGRPGDVSPRLSPVRP
jgi:transposase-like protein